VNRLQFPVDTGVVVEEAVVVVVVASVQASFASNVGVDVTLKHTLLVMVIGEAAVEQSSLPEKKFPVAVVPDIVSLNDPVAVFAKPLRVLIEMQLPLVNDFAAYAVGFAEHVPSEVVKSVNRTE
jgi:hypothetical protein